MRNRLGRAVAWIVALGLLAYLLRRASPGQVMQAARSAAPWTIPVLAALVVLVYLADSLAMWRVFGWFVTRLSFREVLVVRGATYMLAMVNYALGQGTIVYFVHRSRGVPVMRGAAAVLLVMGSNMLLLLFATTAGLVLGPDLPRGLVPVVTIAYAGLAVYIVLVVARPRWLTTRPIFDVLLGAGLGGHLKAVVVRVPHLLSLLVFSYVSMRAFGINIPVVAAVTCLPVVFFIAVLPISPAGLGTMQAAMTWFFLPYATEATILASSLTAQGIAIAVQAVVGLACLRNQMARQLPAPSPP
jgi:Lysylphosphatidylglycerol synthase TM region